MRNGGQRIGRAVVRQWTVPRPYDRVRVSVYEGVARDEGRARLFPSKFVGLFGPQVPARQALAKHRHLKHRLRHTVKPRSGAWLVGVSSYVSDGAHVAMKSARPTVVGGRTVMVGQGSAAAPRAASRRQYQGLRSR